MGKKKSAKNSGKESPTIVLNTVGKSFDDIRVELHDVLGTGKRVKCPCCDKRVHVDTRKITDRMALQVVALARADRPMHCEELIHLPNPGSVNGRDRMYGFLAHWGLAEKAEDWGYWQVTELGRRFARNEVDVPLRLFVYNNTVVGVKGDKRVTLKNCAGESFDLPDVFATPTHLKGASIDTTHTQGPAALG